MISFLRIFLSKPLMNLYHIPFYSNLYSKPQNSVMVETNLSPWILKLPKLNHCVVSCHLKRDVTSWHCWQFQPHRLVAPYALDRIIRLNLPASSPTKNHHVFKQKKKTITFISNPKYINSGSYPLLSITLKVF